MQPLFWLSMAGIFGYAIYKLVMLELGRMFHFIGTTEINDVWDD
jgi:hypothetical protein